MQRSGELSGGGILTATMEEGSWIGESEPRRVQKAGRSNHVMCDEMKKLKNLIIGDGLF